MAGIMMPSIRGVVEEAPSIRPKYNVGGMFDLPAGDAVVGKWGNTFINGGLSLSTGIVGPNNSYKSTLSKYFMLALFNNCPFSNGITLDTEISGTGGMRYNQLTRHMPNLQDIDFTDTERWMVSSNAEVYGDVFWDKIKEYGSAKAKAAKDIQVETPFIDKVGKYLKALPPTYVEIDSLSQLSIGSVVEKFDDFEAGDAKRNTEDMANGRAKSKIVRDIPVVTATSGMTVTLTAHVGEKIEMDQYNPSMKKFSNMKGNRTVKHIPESFAFNMNNCYEIISAKPLINSSTKAPEFPKPGDELRGDTDLYELVYQNLRGKVGGSSIVLSLLCSQSEGVLDALSCFYHLKLWKFGFTEDSNDRSYALALYPECKLSRATVRGKIDSDPVLRRAIRLTCDLFFIRQFKKFTRNVTEDKWCNANDLYKDIKNIGYEWSELLDTINEWQFKEAEQTKPTLTIYDLLNMRAGDYVPYWKQDAWKKIKRKEGTYFP
nr:MAG TPA: AAA domain protein [Caudoviricetes sp.]